MIQPIVDRRRQAAATPGPQAGPAKLPSREPACPSSIQDTNCHRPSIRPQTAACVWAEAMLVQVVSRILLAQAAHAPQRSHKVSRQGCIAPITMAVPSLLRWHARPTLIALLLLFCNVEERAIQAELVRTAHLVRVGRAPVTGVPLRGVAAILTIAAAVHLPATQLELRAYRTVARRRERLGLRARN